MSRFSHGSEPELFVAALFQLVQLIALDVAGLVQNRDELLHFLAGDDLAPGKTGEDHLGIEGRVCSVEALKHDDPRRRDHEDVLGVEERVSQQEPWLLGKRGRHDIDVTPQSRQQINHPFFTAELF